MGDKEFYNLLDLVPTCNQDEIKKAFRKKALQYHPDKGGDLETFKKINLAYETLSDPEKRRIYDSTGKTDINPNNINPEDILKNMFGNMFPETGFFSSFGNMFSSFRNNSKPKTPPIIYNYSSSLENICTSKEVKLKFNRILVCDCVQKLSNCKECGGQGVKIIMSRLGPLLTHNTISCQKCSGSGKECIYCDNCVNGNINEEKIVSFNLSPEFEDGHNIIFKSYGNQNRNCEIGDFVVVVKYIEHPVFKTEGKNLLYTKELSLKDALIGHEISLTHPSGDSININVENVIDPNTRLEVSGQGISKDGLLIINFKILFPKELSEESKKMLRYIELN